MFCKECGKEIPNDSAFCPSCGTALVEQPVEEYDKTTKDQNLYAQPQIHKPQSTYRKKLFDLVERLDPRVKIGLMAGFCCLALLFIILAIGTLTSEDMADYMDDYILYMDKADEVSNEVSYGRILFSSAYDSIAERYKEMAMDELKEIWKLRARAIVELVFAVVFAFLAFALWKIKSENKSSVNRSPEVTLSNGDILGENIGQESVDVEENTEV